MYAQTYAQYRPLHKPPRGLPPRRSALLRNQPLCRRRSPAALGALQRRAPQQNRREPRSRETLGRSPVFAQAELLRLYDTDRARTARQGDQELSLNGVAKALDELRQALAPTQGAGAAIVVAPIPSPSLQTQLNGDRKSVV